MCTVNRLIDKKGTILTSRTMEFATSMGWQLVAVPRHMQWISPSPTDSRSLVWKNRFGFIGIGGSAHPDFIQDGMNEAGLAFSALWYEADMRWQDVGEDEQDRALANVMFGSWVLGNFRTVGEVTSALSGVKVFGHFAPAIQIIPPLHFIIFDASGGCIVIEFENGQVQVHENTLGILTNAPEFSWHLNNIRQYIHLTNRPVPPLLCAGRNFVTTAVGEGMVGLPGDTTSPSRFLKMVFLTHHAMPSPDPATLLKTARHIANTVDIVKGTELLTNPDGSFNSDACTQWMAFRDLTHRVYYYHTYDNPNLRKVELAAISFDGTKVCTKPLDGQQETVVDVTAGLAGMR